MQSKAIESRNSQGLRDDDLPQSYPFIKWAGGKTQLLFEIDQLIPSEFNQYFEPFLGGGAIFFHVISNKNIQFTAYLSDVNEELINTFNVVKNDVEKLIKVLKNHEVEYIKNPSEYYYELRADIKSTNDIQRAARFITLNKTCYNGLYRVNKKGIFNVPIGSYKNPVICDSDNLKKVSIALRYSKAQIQLSDYKKILVQKAEEDDFIYLDPPYKPTSSTANFTDYTNTGFNDKDQRELAHVFKKLNDRRCKVLLSNSDTPLIRKLYCDFTIQEVQALRAINCKASKRVGHKELLIRNYSY
jgi:DNA adenine methylase